MQSAESALPLFTLIPVHEEVQDDFYLPSQQPTASHLTGWHRLAWALLEDAFGVKRRCVRGRAGNALKRQQQHDEEWIGGAPALILFVDLCDGLGIDPDAVRKQYATLTTGRRNGHHRAPA
jgi:hypothetical protein